MCKSVKDESRDVEVLVGCVGRLVKQHLTYLTMRYIYRVSVSIEECATLCMYVSLYVYDVWHYVRK
jgi:hypothetical protein